MATAARELEEARGATSARGASSSRALGALAASRAIGAPLAMSACKKVGTRPRRRLSRDAAFFRQALDAHFRSLTVAREASVCRAASSRPVPYAMSSDTPSTRAKSRTWWQTHGLQVEAGRSPPSWRDCTDQAKALLAHLALSRSPDLRGFTLRLSTSVERQARLAMKGPLEYLRRRVAEHLRKVLGPDVSWWTSLEESSDRQLHLHGEFVCPAAMLDEVRHALRSAGGEWPKGSRQFQIKLEHHPDERWAAYCAKGLSLATDSRRALMARYGCTSSRWVASFRGGAFTMSNSARAAARAALEELAGLVRRSNQTPGDPPGTATADAAARSNGSGWSARALQRLLQNIATKRPPALQQAIAISRLPRHKREFNPLSQHQRIPLTSRNRGLRADPPGFCAPAISLALEVLVDAKVVSPLPCLLVEPTAQSLDESRQRSTRAGTCSSSTRRNTSRPGSACGCRSRVRGSQQVGQERQPRAGSIPAGAGEPFQTTSVADSLGVHPRGCGGASKTADTSRLSLGPSPRVRGSRAVEEPDVPVVGSIPAGAGEPELVAGEAGRHGVHPRGCGGASLVKV